MDDMDDTRIYDYEDPDYLGVDLMDLYFLSPVIIKKYIMLDGYKDPVRLITGGHFYQELINNAIIEIDLVKDIIYSYDHLTQQQQSRVADEILEEIEKQYVRSL